MGVIQMTENERVKELRKKLGLTLDKFGKRIGITKGALSQLESGRTNPSDQTRRSICREFGVSENWLRTGEGDMFAQRAEAEDLAATVNRLLTGESDEFKRRLIIALSTLTDEQWLVLEQKLKEIFGAREAVPASAPVPNESDKSDARELARQILQDKKAEGGSSASSGGAGKGKMA